MIGISCKRCAGTVVLILAVLGTLPSPPITAQTGNLTVTITSDNAYMFGFGDVNGIDPKSFHGAVWSIDSKDIYGGRVTPVRIEIYDLLGRQRATVFDARCEAGTHSAEIGTAGLTSGTYLVRMSSGTRSKARLFRIVR
ncbi:MAG: T9SS type A sorting domain-containing protein [Bacteroidetes bacterium]|nr:T9SS type A sorting domain-containing protein [Bacteroidota bacterium]